VTHELQLLSLVVPVFNEGDNFARLIAEIDAKIHAEHEIVVVYDFDEDNTLPVIRARFADRGNLRLVKNPTRGVLNAIKAGFAAARGDAMLVVMADVSDDLVAVDGMLDLMRSGYDLVCGSRYMRGGKQLGGPVVKSLLSRAAGLSLHHILGIPTHDITNSFKLYHRRVIEGFTIESDGGFEIGMELTLKAYLAGMRVTEVPSVWTDRAAGKSNFKLLKWLPKYLRWYFTLIYAGALRKGRRSRRARSSS
jgi:glycosyltransferase involved in cell wall biosynthesis